MNLPVLKIGSLVPKFPIVQGGMAIRISTAPLAAAVAQAGGVGTIAGTGMSLEELAAEIRQAKKITQGVIGVNVLFAARNFAQLVRTALREKVDFIVSGAGFSRDMFIWGRESDTAIIPIVSSARLAKLAEKMGAAALVVEGVEAGGHLGTDLPLKEILKDIRDAVKIPIIAAGGIATGQEAAEILSLGADGVQLATRFLASDECTAPRAYKEMHLNVKPEDIVTINSPVGLPGKAIRNSFSERLASGLPMDKDPCSSCLKKCSHYFCIFAALNRAQQGDMEKGLIFSGESAVKLKEIQPVETIMADLVQGIKDYMPQPDK
jgi:nitronate monooxygenase